MKARDQTPDPDDLFLPSAAGRVLGVSADAVRTLIDAGKLPGRRLVGGMRAVRREDLERLAAERAGAVR
jgi:excisionase family DNA binding protein